MAGNRSPAIEGQYAIGRLTCNGGIERFLVSAEPGAEHPEQVSDGDGPGPDIGHASGVQIGSGNLQVNFYAEPTWPRNEQQVQSSRSRRGRVEAYLVAAKAAAGIHPYTSHLSGEPSLRKVYVPQGLSAYAPHFSTGTMPGADEAPGPGAGTPTARGQQQELTDAAALMQKLNVLDVLHRHSGVLITGAPGTGKSCLLRHVVGELSDAWLEQGSESCVPVLIRAQALTKNMSFHEAVASAVTAELATLTDDPSLRTLFDDEPFPGVPWLVLVDGIDEVSNPAARSGVLRSIAQRSGDAKYRFLLAGRDLPSLDFDLLEEADFKRFEIQLLTWEESTLLASRWFSATGGPETAARQTERFRTMLERGRTAQLARNPLVATAISVSITKDPGGELPLSRADVYENLVDRLIQEPITSTRFLDNLRSLIPDHAADSRGAVNKVLQQLRPLTQFLADRRRSQTADEPLVEYAQEYPGCRLPAHVGDSL
jgi:Cdc6-like AAA superfamily ATPase